MAKSVLVTTPKQLVLDLKIVAEREIDGIGMGVLENGTPFLNIRGLARMCGVDHASLVRITEEWVEPELKPRVRRIKEMVREAGYDDTTAFIAVERKGTLHHAVPDGVCMAVLEYYAFEATEPREQARKSFRTLAKKGLRDFIYSQVGYNPSGAVDIAWKQFHDRVELTHHAVPSGYFCVFKEIAGMFVTMIKNGANPGVSFIPDISVGQHWSKYWTAEGLDIVHGDRKKFDHNYPDYFPQAISNPQEVYCYPNDALGDFRHWLETTYIPAKMPSYIGSKVKDGTLPAKLGTAALAAFQPAALPKK